MYIYNLICLWVRYILDCEHSYVQPKWSKTLIYSMHVINSISTYFIIQRFIRFEGESWVALKQDTNWWLLYYKLKKHLAKNGIPLTACTLTFVFLFASNKNTKVARQSLFDILLNVSIQFDCHRWFRFQWSIWRKTFLINQTSS